MMKSQWGVIKRNGKKEKKMGVVKVLMLSHFTLALTGGNRLCFNEPGQRPKQDEKRGRKQKKKKKLRKPVHINRTASVLTIAATKYRGAHNCVDQKLKKLKTIYATEYEAEEQRRPFSFPQVVLMLVFGSRSCVRASFRDTPLELCDKFPCFLLSPFLNGGVDEG